MNIERARFNMVEQQIRPWEVLDQRVLDLMEDAPRDAFVPEDFRRLAYADISIPLGEGEVMMPPRVEARMIQALRLDPEDRVLEVGTGSGFATFLLSRCAAYVTTVEVSERLATFGRSNLERHGVRNVNSETGDAGSGWERDAPYDAIAVTGSIPALEDTLARQLTVGGRLFAVIGQGPAMEALLVERVGENEWTRDSLFDTVLPPLRGVTLPDRFEF